MRTTTSKWLAAMALLASLSYSLPAATVTAMVQRVTGAWATNSVISLFPSNTPAIYNGGFSSSASARMTVSSNGWASNRLEMGTYKFSIDQSTRDMGTVFIPDGDGTYNLWSLISSTNVTFNTNINIHVLQSDFLTASNYLASLGGGGGSAFGVWSNATLIATNPVALRWTNAGNAVFTLASNAAGVSISATVDLGVTNALATLEAATYLTNWANAVSNYANTKQHGHAVLSNAVATGVLTNPAVFQPADSLLSNLVTNPRTDWTNQLAPGNNITLTTNSAGVVTVDAMASGGGGLTTNANQFAANDTLSIKDGALLTNVIFTAGIDTSSSRSNWVFNTQSGRVLADFRCLEAGLRTVWITNSLITANSVVITSHAGTNAIASPLLPPLSHSVATGILKLHMSPVSWNTVNNIATVSWFICNPGQ